MLRIAVRQKIVLFYTIIPHINNAVITNNSLLTLIIDCCIILVMKKVIVILICCMFSLLIGCSNLHLDNDFNHNTPDQIFPLPDDNEELEEKKKYYIASKVNGLRVRSGKGTNYSILGSLDTNDMLIYKGIDGEYYITIFKEQRAFVHKDYCDIVAVSMENEKIEKAIDFGSTLLGYPYVWGSQRYHWGNGKLNSNFENGKFDCSALVQYIYFITNDVILDVTSRAQAYNGKEIPKNELKRGDLMFFTNASRKNKVGNERIGHVGIYFGNNYILHTASDHAVLEPISSTRWSYYITARRVL